MAGFGLIHAQVVDNNGNRTEQNRTEEKELYSIFHKTRIYLYLYFFWERGGVVTILMRVCTVR